MSDELRNELNNQFTLLNLMKLYLIKKRNFLIEQGIERILDGKEIFRHSLKENITEFEKSINKDFDLMIQYCVDFKIKPLQKRKLIKGFEPIYKDFYLNLHRYVQTEETKEKQVDKMLKQTFKNFAKNNFSD